MIRTNTTSQRPVNLYDFLMTNRRPMAVTFSGIMLMVIAVTFLGQKSYTSEAKLFVRLGRESVAMDPAATAANDQVVMVQESREFEINSLYELLKSRAVLGSVVESLGPKLILDSGSEEEKVQTAGLFASISLFSPSTDEDKALKHLDNHLSIKPAKKSHIINITYEARTPELARDVVARVIEQARDLHLKVNRTDGSQEFLETQAQQLRSKVEQLDGQLRDLKNSTGIASLPEQRGLKLRQIADLQDALRAVEASIGASTAEVAALEASLNDLPETITTSATTGMPQTAAATMRSQLFTAQTHEKELLSRLTPAHPLAIAAHDHVAALEAVLDGEKSEPQVSQGPNEAHEAIKLVYLKASSLLASQQAQHTAVGEQLASVQKELAILNDSEAQMARLQREIDLETASYKKYSEHLEQSRIDGELAKSNISNLNVLQPPSYSLTATSPRRLMNLVLGFAAALASSLGVGLVIEQRRSGLLRSLLGYGPAASVAEPTTHGLFHGRMDQYTTEVSLSEVVHGVSDDSSP